MRRLLGTFAILLALTGCGADGPTATDPPSEAVPVRLVSATAGRGEPADRATDVGDDAALSSYVDQFSAELARRVRAEAARVEVGSGETLVAQVVMIGCDKPRDVRVRASDTGVELVPTPVPTPRMECFAPVTTVGLAAVPVSRAGGS